MSKLLNIIKRASRRWQMHGLESHIDGCDECLECVRDHNVRHQIKLSRAGACKELARIRAEYNATFPPGERVVWRAA